MVRRREARQAPSAPVPTGAGGPLPRRATGRRRGMVFLPADGTPSGREERVLAREGWDHRRGPGSPGVGRHLERLSPTDAPRWAAVARETAGVVSQLARRLEARPGELAPRPPGSRPLGTDRAWRCGRRH